MTALALSLALLTLCLRSYALRSVQHVLPPPVDSGNIDQALPPDIIRNIQSIVDAHEVPGLSVAFVQPGGAVEYGSWGVRTEDGDSMTSDTLFIIASCSKAFTAAAIGLLIEDYAAGRNVTSLPNGVDRLDWDTKLKDILPGEWQLMDGSASEMAALKDILSHQTGVPRHDLSYSREDGAKDMVSRLRYLRPAFEIRERWHYNNIMYMTAQHIITTYAGSFTDYVRDRIFLPLNMTSTTYSASKAFEGGKPTQTWDENGRRLPWAFKDSDIDLIAGAGGIISSAQDMSRWVQMLLNGGVDPVSNRRILTPDIIDAGYGMGWFRSSYRGHSLVMHGGSLPGMSALVALSPYDGVGIVALANGDNKHAALNEAALTILHKVWGQQPDHATQSPFVYTSITGDTNGPRPPRADVLEDLPPYDFTGVYLNEGYGAFVLCDSRNTSGHCASVLDDFATVYAPEKPRTSELYAAWPRFSTSHMRASYVGGMRFVVQALQLYPEGYGKNTTPFALASGSAFADFVVRDDGEVLGFGLFGLVGEKTNREKKGGNIEETADVWFDRATWKRVQ
ncbi:unnamed protein product [Peniophora sp. CBMAI 1063]|nr:unnamed protein product [Peniophora sp. CBMAI 1063]